MHPTQSKLDQALNLFANNLRSWFETEDPNDVAPVFFQKKVLEHVVLEWRDIKFLRTLFLDLEESILNKPHRLQPVIEAWQANEAGVKDGGRDLEIISIMALISPLYDAILGSIDKALTQNNDGSTLNSKYLSLIEHCDHFRQFCDRKCFISQETYYLCDDEDPDNYWNGFNKFRVLSSLLPTSLFVLHENIAICRDLRKATDRVLGKDTPAEAVVNLLQRNETQAALNDFLVVMKTYKKRSHVDNVTTLRHAIWSKIRKSDQLTSELLQALVEMPFFNERLTDNRFLSGKTFKDPASNTATQMQKWITTHSDSDNHTGSMLSSLFQRFTIKNSGYQSVADANKDFSNKKMN